MDPQEYVDARWSALVRAAVLLGASESAAPDIVRGVLEADARRIRRARDPDPLVHRALAAAIPGSERTPFGAETRLEARREMLIGADQLAATPSPGPPLSARRRRRPVVAVAATITLAVAATLFATTGRDRPLGDHLHADQVPSLFGYDGPAARAMLEARGFEVALEPSRACQVMDRVVGSDPPAGATYDPGDEITVYTSRPADMRCLADYRDRAAGWAFVDFANGRGPAPRFADRVFVYVGDGPADVLPRSRAVDAGAWREALEPVRRATHRVALVDEDPLTYDLPSLSVADAAATTAGCGVPDPPLAGAREALSVVIGAPAGRAACPVRMDLYRSRGAIDAVVVYER